VTDDDVYRRIAAALAEDEIPAFSADEQAAVSRAIQAVVPFGGPANPLWLADLRAQVGDLSDGAIIAEEISATDYPGPLGKGPAVYLRLRNGPDRYAMIGDFIPPVEFAVSHEN